MVALFSIFSSLFWGLSNVTVRIGLRSTNPLSGAFISTLSSFVITVVIGLFTLSFDQFFKMAIIYFMAAGLMGPFIARYLLYIGIDRVGASIASPLYEIKPLFSAIAAILILSEKVTPHIFLGTILMIVGLAIIGSEESGGKVEKKWSKKDLIYPLLSGACYGLTHVLRKIGFNGEVEPIAGVLIQNATASVLFPCLVMIQRKNTPLILNKGKVWLILSLAGCFTVIAQLFMFYALYLGKVIIVTPLSSLSPLFVLVLMRIFFKKMQRVTWKITSGTLLIFIATIILIALKQGLVDDQISLNVLTSLKSLPHFQDDPICDLFT